MSYEKCKELDLSYEECVDHPLTECARHESLIHVDNVSKSFINNDGTKKQVLDGFTFDIKDIYEKPQVVALLGQSGSGKTTALRLIAGLDKPDSGQVLISNGGRKDHCMYPVEAGLVGVVFQKYPLFNNLTVLENLVQPAINSGLTREMATEKAMLYLKAFDMESSTGSYPVQLSGGMRQRIAILQQLMVEDRHFIVLDEPFSGLDVKNLQSVITLLHQVANMHTLNTFIVVTHDVTNALILCDTIYVLGRPNKDEKGNPTGAAKIVHEYDLIAEGLAYHPNIEDIPRFNELRKELKYNIIPKV